MRLLDSVVCSKCLYEFTDTNLMEVRVGWSILIFGLTKRERERERERQRPVPVTARSKTSVCGRSPAEIVGSNPTGGMDVCLCECCVLSGRGLCYELITRPEESYRLWCVVVCDLETSRMRKPWPALGRSTRKKRERGTMIIGKFQTQLNNFEASETKNSMRWRKNNLERTNQPDLYQIWNFKQTCKIVCNYSKMPAAGPAGSAV
jgi:hypothetical protein